MTHIARIPAVRASLDASFRFLTRSLEGIVGHVR
jgi:hypothetical protein